MKDSRKYQGKRLSLKDMEKESLDMLGESAIFHLEAISD